MLHKNTQVSVRLDPCPHTLDEILSTLELTKSSLRESITYKQILDIVSQLWTPHDDSGITCNWEDLRLM
ncbi:MAG: hypothetical protein J07HQW1_00057 [Haloquadratum walsbyi J07HQW1]|uniref:Uncharacterized protein n=1 Tax=Haloquadratum walsbyi J07HQW1 TaxID=1238424 RepID=U1MKD8_9EURY|nr:MAG: hypothetical protein J07HQW1_00057 [Haloquadratum walsbyi J07HQW1]